MPPDLFQAFKQNSVIEHHNPQGVVEVLRVILPLPQEQILGVMNIYDKNAQPFFLDISSEETRGAIQPVAHDPFAKLLMLEDINITPGRLKHRDNAWKIMQSVIFSAEMMVRREWFIPRERIKLIQSKSQELMQANFERQPDGTSKKKNSNESVKPRTIVKYMRQLFTRGLHKNALLNGYDKIGQLKIDKDGKKEKRIYKKRPGRKPADILFYENATYGIITTAKIEGFFKDAIDKGLEKRESLDSIYVNVLDKHFSLGVNEKGGFIHLPEELCPTFRQFYFYFQKLCKEDPTKYEILKHGQRYFTLNTRAPTGDSMFFVDGSGAVYQVDSTPLPFALRSSLNRKWIIGIQYLYTVIDCFSELIVGWSLDYKQSWRGAQNALICAFSNKKAILEKYRLSHLIHAFPAEGVCAQLVSDNASEWTGYNSDNLTDLSIDIANPEAYRPDLKGGIEAILNAIQSRLKNIPGSLYYTRQRGEKDPQLTAALNRFEFMRRLICEIADHNRYTWIKNYPLRREMIAEEILPVPVELWDYGIKNLSGALSTYPEEYILKTLLPRKSASIDGLNILCEGHHYISQTALDAQMPVRTQINGRESVTVSIDQDAAGHVYLHLENGEMEECLLSKADQAYIDASWDDIDAFSKHYNHLKRRHKAKGHQNRSNISSYLKPEQDNAIKETKEATKGLSKRSQKSNIRKNAEREEKHERDQKATSTNNIVASQSTGKPPFKYIPPPNYQDVIDNVNQHTNQENQNG